KRKERIPFEVAIRSSFHVVVAERRQLIGRFVEGDRKPPGRTDISKQHIGEGKSRRLTRIPQFDNRRDVLGGPVDRNSASVQQYKDHRFFGRNYCFQKLFLLPGKPDFYAITALETGDIDRH